VVLIGVPPDVERLRRDLPAVAAQWRPALRAELQPYVASPDWRVTTFDRTGTYVVERSA
jgi:predicted GNAT superfamily acetyltransferase